MLDQRALRPWKGSDGIEVEPGRAGGMPAMWQPSRATLFKNKAVAKLDPYQQRKVMAKVDRIVQKVQFGAAKKTPVMGLGRFSGMDVIRLHRYLPNRPAGIKHAVFNLKEPAVRGVRAVDTRAPADVLSRLALRASARHAAVTVNKMVLSARARSKTVQGIGLGSTRGVVTPTGKREVSPNFAARLKIPGQDERLNRLDRRRDMQIKVPVSDAVDAAFKAEGSSVAMQPSKEQTSTVFLLVMAVLGFMALRAR